MIINELSNLFERLVKQGESLPLRGWSVQKISFRLVITAQGELVRIEDARDRLPKRSKKGEVTGYNYKALETSVLGNTKPSGSGINPCFLWDNAAYLLGSVEAKDKAIQYFGGLRERHLMYEEEINSSAYSAVCRFLEQWEPSNCVSAFNNSGLDFIKDFATGNGVFRIQGDNQDVHWDGAIRTWWENGGAEKWAGKDTNNVQMGICLASGKKAPIARLHEPKIKGVNGAQVSGAAIVSFNCSSFESYGKSQGGNAPVSEQITHAYCSALNWLLSNDSHHVRLAESTIVFWTDAPQKEEDEEFAIFTRGSIAPDTLEAQDNPLLNKVAARMKKIARGSSELAPEEDKKWAGTNFYILGLSPNSGRLSIRFFCCSSMKKWYDKLAAHYQALHLVSRKGWNDPEIISPGMILCETVFQKKMDRVSPLSGGALMRSILQGLPYPDSIAIDIMRRCRADGEINYIRCAYLKAWLTRRRKDHPYKLTPMLDETNTQPGYVLGRLLAVLDKTQHDALHLERTIKDAYYGSASASPRSIFPRLMRLHVHHVNALDNDGLKVMRRKQVQEIMSLLGSNIPAHLNLEQQGLFALGFYQQMQSLFQSTKNND